MGDGHLSPGAGQGGGVGGGGDAVRQGRPGGALQRLAALYHHHRRTGPGNVRPAGTQKVRQVAYFGLAGGPAQDGCAARLGRGHHQGHGSPHAGQAQGEIYPVERSAPPQCHGDALQFHLGTHGRQPGQVDVDGTGAQLAAAGQRQAHLAHPAEQRRQVEHRAAHGPGEVVGNLPLQVLAGGQRTGHSPAVRPWHPRIAAAPGWWRHRPGAARPAGGWGYGTAGWQPAAAVRCFWRRRAVCGREASARR